jgi:hypothetical protein
MRHVQWDEQALNEAAHQVASIPKRQNRPPPEPKTPYPSNLGAEGEAPPAMRLSDSKSSDEFSTESGVEGEDFEDQEETLEDDINDEGQFIKHRKEHYKGDGEAFALGSKLIESDNELADL